MALPAMGYEELIGFGLESVYGAGVAASNFLEPITSGLTRDQPNEALPIMTGVPAEIYYGDIANDRPRIIEQIEDVGGPIVFPLEFHHLAWFLRNFMCAETGASDGYDYSAIGANAASHTFDIPMAPDELHDSFTINRYNGAVLRQFKGCHIRSIVIDSQPSGIITCTVNVLGQSMVRNAGTGTIAYVPSANARIWHSTIGIDAVGATPSFSTISDIHGWTLTMEKPLRQLAHSGTGGPQIAEPIIEGPWNITLKLNSDWVDDTYQDIIHHATLASRFQAVELAIDSGVETAESGTNFTATFTFPAMVFEGTDPTHSGGMGPIPQELMLKAGVWANGATKQLAQCVVENEHNTTLA